MEKRKHSRSSLITDFKTQFRLGGQEYTRIQVSNIGAHGCCVRLPVASAAYLKGRPVLENMILMHTDAKKYSLKGRVAWFDDGMNSNGQWIDTGVEFLETPKDCAQEISEYVAVTRK